MRPHLVMSRGLGWDLGETDCLFSLRQLPLAGSVIKALRVFASFLV